MMMYAATASSSPSSMTSLTETASFLFELIIPPCPLLLPLGASDGVFSGSAESGYVAGLGVTAIVVTHCQAATFRSVTWQSGWKGPDQVASGIAPARPLPGEQRTNQEAKVEAVATTGTAKGSAIPCPGFLLTVSRRVQGVHTGCTRAAQAPEACASVELPLYTPCTQRPSGPGKAQGAGYADGGGNTGTL